MKHAVRRGVGMAHWEEVSKDPEKLIKICKAFREYPGQKSQTRSVLRDF